MLLIGEYKVAVGDKNRIALPKKIRQILGEKVIITRGYEGCALLLNSELWQKLRSRIDQESLFKLTVRDTKRFLLGGATEIELDSQGRFVMPEYLAAHVALEQEIVFIGMGDWVEIWSQARWQEKVSYLISSAADIADKLGQ